MAAETQRTMPWWEVFAKYSIFEAADSGWSLIVVSLYFPIFLDAVLGWKAHTFGWAVTTGALVVALLSPMLGTAADVSGRRQPYLRAFVFGVVAFTAPLGVVRTPWLALAMFTLAYICVNGAFIYFQALLPAVSSVKTVATVVALTVGTGYAGNLINLTFMSMLAPDDARAGRVFLPMALVYLLFAIPPMFLCPDFEPKGRTLFNVGESYRRLGQTFREARNYRYLFRFLVGDFLYENAVASVITLMSPYARNVMGMEAGEITRVFGPALVIAVLTAWFVFGPLVRRVGPKKMVVVDLVIWLVMFGLALAIHPETTFRLGSLVLGGKTLFTISVAPLVGMGLAGVWSSSRVLMTALTPVGVSGEFWGLYNLSGRSASVLGDATWSLMLTLVGETIFGYKMAVVALAAYIAAGLAVIVTLPDARPSTGNFLQA